VDPVDLARVSLAHIDFARAGGENCSRILRSLITPAIHVPKPALRAAHATQLGRYATALQKLVTAARSLRFFDATVAALKEGGSESEKTRDCPVCLESVDKESAAILPCSHVFHHLCIHGVAVAAPAAQRPMCPTCRAPFRASECITLGIAAASSTSAKGFDVDRFGSKLAAVGQTLRSIAASDPRAKAIVFVQWRELELLVSEALDRMGVAHIRLHGPASCRGKLLAAFQEQEHPNVLLQSLENSASGANLTRASHVLLVHPMDADSPERAVAYEMQALGRVRRCGQKANRVHLWRFVTLGTVEEDISREHHHNMLGGFSSTSANS